MAATFDLWQQSYTLAQMSGAVSSQQGDPATLASALNTLLNNFYTTNASYLGPWSTVWGPVVFESSPGTSSYADNVMYVAASGDQSVYLVGIAGTNPNSQYDINQEDLAVNSTVSWDAAFPSLQPYGIPTSLSTLSPFMSAGTALGVNNLLAMVDGLQGTNEGLVDFLNGLPTSTTQAATLIFCGHSLAGALSPTLALALFNPAQGKLSASQWANVYFYPTAGPTPGNADLGTFLSTVFPQVGPSGSTLYQTWNANVWNSIDVVPHAWEIAMIDEITTIYPASWKTPPLKLTLGVDSAKDQSNDGAADTNAGPYTPIPNQELQGTFNSGIPVSDLTSFEAQALYQHTTAYDVLLNVTALSPGAQMQAAYAPLVHALVNGEAEVLAGKSRT
jgi:hypothetical protein